MNELPKIVRERLRAAQAGDHPDSNLLSAFAEQALPERDRTRVLDHLARCGECREVVALAGPVTSAGASGIDTAAVRRVAWWSWPVLRWAAVGTCVVAVGSAVLMERHIFLRTPAQEYAVRETQPASEFPPVAPAGRYATVTPSEPRSDSQQFVLRSDGTPMDKGTVASRDAAKGTRSRSLSLTAKPPEVPRPSDTAGRDFLFKKDTNSATAFAYERKAYSASEESSAEIGGLGRSAPVN